jgi:hypothetical protein
MNGLRRCGIYTIEFYSAIRKNEAMWFGRKMDAIGGHHVKWSK